MPQPVTTVYQAKGRKHIEYIKRMAMRIWSESYGCRDDGDGAHYRQSIKDAMTIHRNYLRTGFKVRPPKMTTNLPLTPPKEEGSFYKDHKSGLWVRMDFN